MNEEEEIGDVNDIEHIMYNDNQKLHLRVTRQEVELIKAHKECELYREKYEAEKLLKTETEERMKKMVREIEQKDIVIEGLYKFQGYSMFGYMLLACYYWYGLWTNMFRKL